ncbi:hypothetical protein BMF94_4249 [Rhodotorula taiwanensis]|uniref:RING-type domain-containing protein n=1 Tax=Rhodotorula taiwanensis TaxID=741276 RepID=A0A2S5B6L3_9BASI|nr:hypothetical protein BMF94_4249 [Rhodotorula taiwanensis]
MSGEACDLVLPRSGSRHRAAFDEVVAAVPDVHPAYLLKLLNDLRYDVSLAVADLETSDYPLNSGGRKLNQAGTSQDLQQISPNVECQCCADSCAIANAARCDAGHGFCAECIRNFVENAISSQKPDLHCFALNTECQASFAPVELKRCITGNILDKLEQVRIDKEVSPLEGLVRCPFCPMAALLDDDEVVFACPECNVSSCRRCQKKAHGSNPCDKVPASQEEALDAVAEAMSASVIRKCPSCKVPCLKVDGCNKRTCGPCGAHFCYVCNKQTDKPGHWNSGGANNGRCPANEDSEKRAAEEAQEARKRKIAELEEMGVSVPSIAKTPKFGPSTPRRTAAQQAALFSNGRHVFRGQNTAFDFTPIAQAPQVTVEPPRAGPSRRSPARFSPAASPPRSWTDFDGLGWHAHEPAYGFAAAGSGVFGGGGFGGARTGTGSWHGGKGTRADETGDKDATPPPAEPEEVMRQRRLYAALARQGRA